MNIEASPKVLLQENKKHFLVLFLESCLVDKLSFFCNRFFTKIPNINDVFEVNFVENMKMAVSLVENVESICWLFGHFFFIKIKKEKVSFLFFAQIGTFSFKSFMFLSFSFLLIFLLLLFFVIFFCFFIFVILFYGDFPFGFCYTDLLILLILRQQQRRFRIKLRLFLKLIGTVIQFHSQYHNYND